MEREVKLSAANYCYKTEYTDVYHVGKSKIHIFSSLEGFITEEDCFKLSKVETSRILLPTPVYQNGRYVGCRTKWQEKDWIYAFYNSGMSLKRNLIEMKEELELLSMLWYDIVDMPFYYSHYDRSILTFDGTFRIRKSDLEKEELERTIVETEENLDVVSEEYEKQKKQFEQRLVASDKAGETTYLDVLLQSSSISEFISL